MATATMDAITAKVKRSEKNQFAKTCDEIGTTPSNAIRMFVSAFNRRGGFPFDPSNPYGFNDETLKAMKDAEEGVNLSGPFKSVDEMFEALED